MSWSNQWFRVLSFRSVPTSASSTRSLRYTISINGIRTGSPPPVCVDFLCCNASAEKAEKLAREHMSNYYMTVMQHYDMAGEHFKRMKGYGDYATNAELLRDIGMQDAANAFTDINTWGTPKQILDKLDKRRQSLGDFDLTVQVSYGGMTLEHAEASIRLFAKEVLPEFQSWKPTVKAA